MHGVEDVAWGSKLGTALQDCESIVRRAAISALQELLFPRPRRACLATPHASAAIRAISPSCGGLSARPMLPPALNVPELLGETRTAAASWEGEGVCVETGKAGEKWSRLIAACLDDVDWEVGLRLTAKEREGLGVPLSCACARTLCCAVAWYARDATRWYMTRHASPGASACPSMLCSQLFVLSTLGPSHCPASPASCLPTAASPLHESPT